MTCCSYSDTSDRLIVCAALLGRMYKGGYDRNESKLKATCMLIVTLTGIIYVHFLQTFNGLWSRVVPSLGLLYYVTL